ncbi:uncharacterized protein MELLADRAFT_67915 [Melampsora larici-populina 98AG31]|uniref:Secreted protein n=1 Tax=Melampsora larici-populina (strain 98AG31 / pathotype 3-4-7) TaxID=747676 RepID=F4S4X5_MELLP|nr:uncharacterized protein MELLADRAFT_67915 [Melampsora larici-populina 98AG31]EGG00221.1 hypothetical protein MELLADRAFT_67915 [Melampsora larici-populina 98AG31]
MKNSWFLLICLSLLPSSFAFQPIPITSLITHDVSESNKLLNLDVSLGKNLLHNDELLNTNMGDNFHNLPPINPKLFKGHDINWLPGDSDWNSRILEPHELATIASVECHSGDQYNCESTQEFPTWQATQSFTAFDNGYLMCVNGQSTENHQANLIGTTDRPFPLYLNHHTSQYDSISQLEFENFMTNELQIYDHHTLLGQQTQAPHVRITPTWGDSFQPMMLKQRPLMNQESILATQSPAVHQSHTYDVDSLANSFSFDPVHHLQNSNNLMEDDFNQYGCGWKGLGYPQISQFITHPERLAADMNHVHTAYWNKPWNPSMSESINQLEHTSTTNPAEDNIQSYRSALINMEDPQPGQYTPQITQNYISTPEDLQSCHNQYPLQAKMSTDTPLWNELSQVVEQGFESMSNQSEPDLTNEKKLSSGKKKALDLNNGKNDIICGGLSNQSEPNLTNQKKLSSGKRKALDLHNEKHDIICGDQNTLESSLAHPNDRLQASTSGSISRLLANVNSKNQGASINHSVDEEKFNARIAKQSRRQESRDAMQTLQKIGTFQVSRTPSLCYEIPLWFYNMNTNLLKDLPQDHIAIKNVCQALKCAQIHVTAIFLGILSVHHHHGDDMALQTDIMWHGWEFLKRFFSQWYTISLKDINFQSSPGDRTSRTTLHTNEATYLLEPNFLLKYLADTYGLTTIAIQIFTCLIYEWTKYEPVSHDLPIDLEKVKQKSLHVYDPDFIYRQGGFYSRAGINNPAWEVLQSKSRTRKSMSQNHKHKTMEDLFQQAEFLSPQGFDMCHDIHKFFGSLLDRLLNSYRTLYHCNIPIVTNEMQRMSQSNDIHSNIHKSNLEKIVQALSMVEYRVTVGFIGLVRALHQDHVTEDQLKMISSNAWKFLKGEFNKWNQLDFEGNLNVLFTAPEVGYKSDKDWLDTQKSFRRLWELAGLARKQIPIKYVKYLLKSWTSTLSKGVLGNSTELGFLATEVFDRNLSLLSKKIGGIGLPRTWYI